MHTNLTATGLPIIQIGFFSDWNTCRHRYTHVELRFSDYTVTSITRYPGRVHLIQDKKMSNPRYRGFFEVATTFDNEAKMRHYAETCTEGFSSFSMYWNFIVPFCPIRRWGFFCSAYICKLLQIGGFCEGMDPYRASPDDLFKELTSDDRVVCSFNNVRGFY